VLPWALDGSETAMFGILGIDHVVLRAEHPAEMERFYVELLGCTVERRQPAIGLTQLRAGRSLVDLIQVPEDEKWREADRKKASNMDHFCLRIEPFDGPALAAYFAARGVAASDVLPRFGAEGEGPSIYIHDPEGNSVELKGPPAA
jgi:glyoxylase I family protein